MAQDARCFGADEYQERLVALAQRLGHRSRHEIRLAQARGADDDGHGVGRALQERADGAAEQIGTQAGQGHVDRVAVEHGVADVEGAQAFRCRLVRRRRLEAGKPGAVGDQRRGPAGRGQDSDPPPRSRRWGARAAGMSSRSAKVVARITPICRNKAS